jgi:hypothetical protein
VDYLTLFAGLLLPWALGIALLLAARDAATPLDGPGECAWIAGAGYVAGAVALTLWMRLLSTGGIRFGVLPIALPLIALTAVLAWVAVKREGWTAIAAATRGALRDLALSPGLADAARVVWIAAIAWLAIRFVLLGLEVAWQPLYPWDAWIQWATKARVWYELGHLAPFARSTEWFNSNGALYFDASPEYPPTVPLLQAWSCYALGRWDDALMNWPWWQFAVALALATYGGLRRLDVGPAGSLVGAFVVSSLPLANVHVALAGYADLPLAAFYAIGVLAFLHWHASRHAGDAIVALALLVACTQTKNPGIAWALTVAPAVLVALMPRRGLTVAAVMFGGALALLALLARTRPIIFNYQLHLDYAPAWSALAESYFLLGNWHLLWYGAIGAALLAWRGLLAPAQAPLTVIIAGGTLFLFFVFGFTTVRMWVTDQTTVNRATLHFAPLVAIFAVLAFRAFVARWSAFAPEAAELPAVESTAPAAAGAAEPQPAVPPSVPA